MHLYIKSTIYYYKHSLVSIYHKISFIFEFVLLNVELIGFNQLVNKFYFPFDFIINNI
jgi:hypothetical protein